MDKPAMNFVFLPGDLKLQIFKELDWETLKDLKLVCKDFYMLTGENTQFLDRPKVRTLIIVFDENKISRVSFMLVLAGERDGPVKDIEFSNDDEYENFLKKIDVTKLKFITFQNAANGEFVHVRCESFSNANVSKYTFSARLPNGRRCVHYLFVTTKSSTEFGILYGCNFLKKDSLRKLGLFEGNGLHVVEKKITVDLLIGSPMLGYEIVPIDTRKPLDIQVMNHLFGLGFFNPEDTCDRKQFLLIFDKVEFSNGCEYGNFLKDKDFTRINDLFLENVANGGSIRLRYDSCPSENFSTIYFSAGLPNAIPSLRCFCVKICITKGLGIPYNSNLLKQQSLRKLGFYGENESNSVVKKAVMDVLTNDPTLDYADNSNVAAQPLYVQITNHLFELGLLHPENKCGGRQYRLHFFRPVEFTTLELQFYMGFFDKIKFSNNLVVENNREGCYIANSMNCSNCGSEHKNSIRYCGYSKDLDVDFH